MSAPLLDRTTDEFREADLQQIVAQTGRMNLLSISGGRVVGRLTGITLPVSNGYDVTIDLAANDTYVVRRVLRRAGKVFLHGQRTNVYAEDLAQAAYYASCFRSYDAAEWVLCR